MSSLIQHITGLLFTHAHKQVAGKWEGNKTKRGKGRTFEVRSDTAEDGNEYLSSSTIDRGVRSSEQNQYQ